MAWASVDSYGFMERWRQRFVQQAYQFQQINDGFSDYSPTVWVQQERNELAQQLVTELDNFQFWTGFYPVPRYTTETIHLQDTLAWWDQSLWTDVAKLQAFGTQGKELLGTANITYSGDVATATLSSVSPITTGEVAFVFNSTDSSSSSGDLRYRIYSLSVSHNGTDYIGIGHKSLFVKPTKQNELDSFIGGDPNERLELSKSDATNFSTTCDVYRLYTDTTVQATLLAESFSDGTITESNVTAIPINLEQGEFKLSASTATALSNTPFAVRVNYLSGYPKQTDGNPYTPFESIVIRRARVNLPIATKEVAYRVSANWQNDHKSIFDMSAPNYYANPIGDRVVDYFTWQTYQMYYDPRRGQARRYMRA